MRGPSPSPNLLRPHLRRGLQSTLALLAVGGVLACLADVPEVPELPSAATTAVKPDDDGPACDPTIHQAGCGAHAGHWALASASTLSRPPAVFRTLVPAPRPALAVPRPRPEAERGPPAHHPPR